MAILIPPGYFSGINFYEKLLIEGKYPTSAYLPLTLGGEFSGEVLLVGENVKDFRKKYPRAYRVSFINNWIIDFFSDEKINKPPKYWFDKDKCKDAAINCKNRYEFLRKYSAAYQNSLKNNWLDEFFPKK